MLEIVLANAFRKDLKRAKKRGLNLDHLTRVLNILAAEEKLPAKYRDYALTGDYSGFRECHIEPDWLLVYRIDADVLSLFLFRIGTHADLF